MIALAIETATAASSLALLTAGGAIDELQLGDDRARARAIAPGIQQLLDRNRLSPKDLELIVVDVGPGGFTGIRLGVATAKTLAAVLKVPLVPVASTAVLAAHPAVPPGDVLALLDAGKGHVYAALYRAGPPREPDGARVVDELAPPALATAEAAARLAGPGAFVARAASLTPRARDLLLVGRIRAELGAVTDERRVLPLYLRPSEAEVLWARRSERRSGA